MKSNPNKNFSLLFIAAGEIQPCRGGWPCMRMRKWEFDPGRGKSTVATFSWLKGRSSHTRFERFRGGFVLMQENQNALNCFLF